MAVGLDRLHAEALAFFRDDFRQWCKSRGHSAAQRWLAGCMANMPTMLRALGLEGETKISTLEGMCVRRMSKRIPLDPSRL